MSEDVEKFWSQILSFLMKAQAMMPTVPVRKIMEQLAEVAFRRTGEGLLVELARQELPDRAFCPKEWARVAWRLMHPYSEFAYLADEDVSAEETDRQAEEAAQEDFGDIMSAARGVCSGELAESPKLWGNPTGGYENAL